MRGRSVFLPHPENVQLTRGKHKPPNRAERYIQRRYVICPNKVILLPQLLPIYLLVRRIDTAGFITEIHGLAHAKWLHTLLVKKRWRNPTTIDDSVSPEVEFGAPRPRAVFRWAIC